MILSIALLFAAVLLIWNTIRTAMFARRREIEVMKLVGATDWFIRIPFMLEGLMQGLIGGSARRRRVVHQQPVDRRRRDFPDDGGFAALVVDRRLPWTVVMVIVAIGALAGAIGSGIAASRFLDI